MKIIENIIRGENINGGIKSGKKFGIANQNGIIQQKNYAKCFFKKYTFTRHLIVQYDFYDCPKHIQCTSDQAYNRSKSYLKY